eukprot:1908946-Prymnesium_polylepis.1
MTLTIAPRVRGVCGSPSSQFRRAPATSPPRPSSWSRSPSSERRRRCRGAWHADTIRCVRALAHPLAASHQPLA